MKPKVLDLLPSRDGVKAKAEAGEELSPLELLVLQSRSFSAPIMHLQSLKGENEADKMPYVRSFYNILRALDNGGEDNNLHVETRRCVLEKFQFVSNELCHLPDELVDGLLKGDRAEYIRRKMAEGAMDREELLFAEQFGKNGVWKEFRGFSPEIRKTIKDSVGTMATGMREYLGRDFETEADLVNYCYYVASSVGEGLNGIVRACDGVELNEDLARALGEVLQLTNIGKNMSGDYNTRGVVYVPHEFFPEVTAEELFNGNNQRAQVARLSVLSHLHGLVNSKFDSAVEYSLSVSDRLTGYKAFCVSPLVSAMETWKAVKAAGSERLFGKGEEADGDVKISPGEFVNIIGFTEELARNKRFNSWLGTYREKRDSFSFKPAEYAGWSEEWVNGINNQ